MKKEATLVITPGAWSTGFHVRELATYCERQGIPTIVVEMPQHGTEQDPSGLGLWSDYVPAVEYVIKNKERVALFGHSMGGLINHFAAQKCDNVVAQIFSATPFGTTLVRRKMLMRLAPYYLRVLSGIGAFKLNDRDYRDFFCGNSPELLNAFVPESAWAIRDIFLLQAEALIGRHREKFEVPTLVLGGELDILVPADDLERITLARGGIFSKIPDADHMQSAGARAGRFVADWFFYTFPRSRPAYSHAAE